MFGKIFITQLRNCVMLVTPLLILILTAFLVHPLQEGHGWQPHCRLHRLYCVAMLLTVSLIHCFKVKSEELGELLGLEPVSLMIQKSRLRWFGHVERKDDYDWVKRCITWEIGGIRQRGRPKKTWWDCVKNDMDSLGLFQKDVQFRNKLRMRIKGATG